jgi:hypothetical protein
MPDRTIKNINDVHVDGMPLLLPVRRAAARPASAANRAGFAMMPGQEVNLSLARALVEID